MPQGQTLFIQKDDSVQKGYLQRHASYEVLYLQSFLCILHRQIQKFKKVIWQDAEEALTSLNSWQTNKRLLFHFYVSFEEWEKGRLFLICLGIDQQTKRITRIKACKFQQSYFKVYIKLEVKERIVGQIEYFVHKKASFLSSFSTVRNTRKLLIITSVKKKIFSSIL